MVSHYELGQGHSWRPCQGSLSQVAVSLTGRGLDAPSGSWRALRGAHLSGWFPVLLVCSFQGTGDLLCIYCRGYFRRLLESNRHLCDLQVTIRGYF